MDAGAFRDIRHELYELCAHLIDSNDDELWKVRALQVGGELRKICDLLLQVHRETVKIVDNITAG